MNSLCNSLCRFRPSSILKHVSCARFLYNSSSVGLDDYVAARKRYELRRDLDDSKFRQKMQETCAGDESHLVFTEDLKVILHTSSEEDINLIEQMMLKFHSQNASLRFGTYAFGPVVMRMFHYLNKPAEALKVFKNEKLDGFFDQLSSHVILMDLLFRNNMFEEVIEVYTTFRNKQMVFGKHPKSAMVLVFGAYYKLNTIEGCNEALNLFKEMNERGSVPLRRATCFMAALALNQNQPDISLEILATLQNQSYVLVRCIKALALGEIGRTDDAISVLKRVLEYDKPDIMKHTFPTDVIEKVKIYVDKNGDKQVIHDFNRVYGQLKDQGHLVDKTLDDLLCSEVLVSNPVNRTQTVLNAAIDKSNDNHKKAFRVQRPGLGEIL